MVKPKSKHGRLPNIAQEECPIFYLSFASYITGGRASSDQQCGPRSPRTWGRGQMEISHKSDAERLHIRTSNSDRQSMYWCPSSSAPPGLGEPHGTIGTAKGCHSNAHVPTYCTPFSLPTYSHRARPQVFGGIDLKVNGGTFRTKPPGFIPVYQRISNCGVWCC